MKPSFRKAGNPAPHILGFLALRRTTIPMVLLATTALAGCATTNPPPEISYDNAAPAVQTVDPPAPVTVVELPRPLPLPGQLQRVPETRRAPEPANPTARVNQANEAARVQPVRWRAPWLAASVEWPLAWGGRQHGVAANMGWPPAWGHCTGTERG